ncbi:MAG TPA: hypothetical protein VMW42_07250, partial [Desulfatiglandales bacterium]|nr:hypothetical protein [Desulfatiglandales bacterium]
TPMDLLIVFEQTSMPVDMSSLYVVAKKGFFSKTLTERLEPYVSGTTIDAKGVKIPKGKFLIEVTIADQDGFKTTGSYLLKVNKGD